LGHPATPKQIGVLQSWQGRVALHGKADQLVPTLAILCILTWNKRTAAYPVIIEQAIHQFISYGERCSAILHPFGVGNTYVFPG
jgi:hypothetical protein